MNHFNENAQGNNGKKLTKNNQKKIRPRHLIIFMQSPCLRQRQIIWDSIFMIVSDLL